jgi:hypothetical protein
MIFVRLKTCPGQPTLETSSLTRRPLTIRRSKGHSSCCPGWTLGILKTPFHLVQKPHVEGQKSSHFGGRTLLSTRPAMIWFGIIGDISFCCSRCVTHLDLPLLDLLLTKQYARYDRIVRREHRESPWQLSRRSALLYGGSEWSSLRPAGYVRGNQPAQHAAYIVAVHCRCRFTDQNVVRKYYSLSGEEESSLVRKGK